MRAYASQTGWAHFTLVFMLGIFAGCSESDAPDDELNPVSVPEVARIVPASEALAGAQVPSLDPATMNAAEIEKALGTGPHCEFRYTNEGKPVLAVKALSDGNAAVGVVKLSGSLVILRAASASGDLVLQAGEVHVALAPDLEEQVEEPDDAQAREATVVFEVGNSLRVGYRGYYKCLD